MKLRRIAIHRLAGIPSPGFTVEGFEDGINLVAGPNGSGKSSLPRAVRAALYDGEPAGEGAYVEVSFDGGEGELEAVRLGRAVTWRRDGEEGGSPPDLPEHRLAPCYLLHLEDLLASDAGTDADIARNVARELAGGYDLGAARKECGFDLSNRHGRKEAEALAAADRKLREVQVRQGELYRQEQRLSDLERERAGAQEAGREAELVERAIELLDRREERLGLERRRAALPPDMDRLTGDEARNLERLREERRGSAEGLEQVGAERRAAERALEETGLGGSGVDEVAIADLRPSLDRLRQLEGEVGRGRTRLSEALAARDRAVAELGGEPGREALIGPEAVHTVEQALGASRAAVAELRALDAEIARLSGDTASDSDPVQDQEMLGAARRELLRWLSASQGSARGPLFRWLGFAAAALAAAFAGAGILAAGLWGRPEALGVLLLLALAVVCCLPFWSSAGGRERREAERRFHALGAAAPPNAWTPGSVEARMFELDREQAEAWRREAERRRRREAEGRREALRADYERKRESFAAIARRVNFAPERLDASFDRWLRLAGQYDQADTEVRAVESRVAHLEREAGKVRAALGSFLAGEGEAPEAGSLAPDADVLGQCLDRLAARVRQREEALRDAAAARLRETQLVAEIARKGEAIEELFRRAGIVADDEPGAPARDAPGGAGGEEEAAGAGRGGAGAHGGGVEAAREAELRGRLSRLEEWRVLGSELDQARGGEDLLLRGLDERPHLVDAVEAGDRAGLVLRRNELAGQADQEGALAEEITRIRTLVGQTENARGLEDARAERQRAEDALGRCREEVRLADAGAFLLERVEEEHVGMSRPAVLARAEDWFGRFTRHQYELGLAGSGSGGGSGGGGSGGGGGGGGRDGGAAFRARETATGEWRALSELSSGTRMQLLLAVRLAFALEAEKGCAPLPFFLDEALTTSDPERYRAAVESLRRFAEEEGRQIVYLTSQPDEAAFWAAGGETNVIDLAESRRTGRAVTHPAEVELPPPAPEFPAPGRRTPEEYAVLIGASPVHPWESPAALDLFHLLRDDLDLLRRLLRAGVDRLGPLAALLDSDEAGLVLSETERAALRRRAAGAEAWVEAWRVGRARPVDRGALQASGEVSERFAHRLEELAEEVGGDARAVLEVLAAGGVPRFREKNRHGLEEWFADHGYLADGGPPLDDGAIGRRVAHALAMHGAPEGVAGAVLDEAVLDEAAQLARALTAGLAHRPPPAEPAGPASPAETGES